MKVKKFETLRGLFDYSTEKFRNNIFLSFIKGEGYTYQQFGDVTTKISKVLSLNGLDKNSKIGILSQNMPNWGVAYLSITAFGRIAVPMLPDFSKMEIDNIIDHSGCETIFISKKLLCKLTEESKSKLKLIIIIDNFEIIKAPENPIFVESTLPKTEDVASIIYTSGTTGKSKGVMLSHKNICAHMKSVFILRPCYAKDVWLSLLPLSHALEFSLSFILPFYSGSSVYYIKKAPTPSVLISALKVVRPTTILSVPLIIEKIYTSKILPEIQNNKVLSKLYTNTLGRKIVNFLVGIKLKKMFGGRLRFFGIGGAKLNGDVETFLREARFPFGIGYGLTETAPLLAGMTPFKIKFQSTGVTMDGVQLRIDNPNPETGEGEIVAKGDNIMSGYYKNPEATADAFTKDGWFRTKDLGIFDKKGNLYIKGRLSNMILGPSGENIYPEEIESVINSHNDVEESLVTEKKGKIVAYVYFNQEKMKSLYLNEEKLVENNKKKRLELIAFYNEKRIEFIEKYDGKKEEFKIAYDAQRKDLYKIYSSRLAEVTDTYNKNGKSVKKTINDTMESLGKEVLVYANSKINKFSKVSIVVAKQDQFEKTATHKIKRYLYSL
ncbi:MAG: AMP-binding protein [Bacteroidetes bacterium]|nr:AMP-binding protein [Bacteroidota bacterium]